MDIIESDEHKWLTVRGTRCIVSQFLHLAKTQKKENDRRRAIKDKLGKVHKDIIMLDSKGSGTSRAFCNGIIYSDNVLTWDQAFKRYYSSFEHTVKTQSGGHQRLLRDRESGEMYLSVSFYVKTHKLMVQPGNKEEENLLKEECTFLLKK